MTFVSREIELPTGLWLAILLGASITAIGYVVFDRTHFAMGDFRAFWCGGQALLHHTNPYLNEPLHSCEASGARGLFAAYPNVTIPDPLPPYAVLILAPFSLIPYSIASPLWSALLVLCSGIVAWGIARLTAFPFSTSLALSFFVILGESIFPGALAPIPIALAVLSAIALQHRRWDAASVLLALSMIEPNVMLPAYILAFICFHQIRMRLIVGALSMFFLALLALGPQVLVYYFTAVLPLHAASELNSFVQYSLATLLFQAGVPAKTALLYASLQYLAMAVTGGFAATRLYRRSRNAAWIVLVPCAFSVVGGAYIHLTQIAIVIPAAALLVAYFPSRTSEVVLIALALPIEVWLIWPALVFPAALICSWLTYQAGANWKNVVLSGGAVLASLPLSSLFVRLTRNGAHTNAAVISAKDLPHFGPQLDASVAWAQYNALSHISAIFWVAKLWTILPLIVVVTLIFRAAWMKRSFLNAAQ